MLKIKFYFIAVGILCCLDLTAQNPLWSPRLSQKIYKTVTYALGPKENIKLRPYNSDFLNPQKGFDEFWNNLSIVEHQDSILGYAYVDQAKSMKKVFDYIVIFSSEFQIIKSKVLIYREKHGKQISSVRWLKQFNNLGYSSKPELGVTIDGVSGATISASSMTYAIRNLLERVGLEINKGTIILNLPNAQ
ncbi:MAG: hypothetical protein ACI9FN_002945 [Saprospiraceae bacterium]|jgi:hypothetical protein